MATAEQLHRRVNQYIARLEPVMAARIAAAYEAIRRSISLTELTALIGSASPERIVATMAAYDDLVLQFSKVSGGTVQEAIDAAKRFTVDLPVDIKKVLGGTAASRTFNVLNPNIVTALRTLDTRVMKNLTDSIRETFLDVVQRGVEAGDPHAKIARQVRDTLGLAKNQAQAVDNFEAMLREGDRSGILGKQVGGKFPKGRVWRDHRFDRTLNKALGKGGKGLTEAQIQKMTAAYRKRAIASNAATHARTAVTDANRLGQKLNWEDAIAQGTVERSDVWKRWSDSGDDRVRPEHVAASGEEVPFDEPFSVTGEDIPGESSFSCRCLAIYFRKPKRVDWKAAQAGQLERGHKIVRGPGMPSVVPTLPTFATTAEAETWMTGRVAGTVDLTGMGVEDANDLARAGFDMIVKPGRKSIPKLNRRVITEAVEANAIAIEDREIEINMLTNNRDLRAFGEKNLKLLAGRKTRRQDYILSLRKQLATGEAYEESSFLGQLWRAERPEVLRKIEALEAAALEVEALPVRYHVANDMYRVFIHEFGHVVHFRSGAGYRMGFGELGGLQGTWDTLTAEGRAVAMKISEYAGANTAEHFAEAWTAYHVGEKHLLSPEVIKLIEKIIKNEAKAGG